MTLVYKGFYDEGVQRECSRNGQQGVERVLMEIYTLENGLHYYSTN